MPFINSKLSMEITKEQEELLKSRLGSAVGLIGKGESFLMVGFEDNYHLYFKGEAFPMLAFVEVKLFGKASKEAYSNMTEEICNIYNEVLSIPKDKIYVKYEEVSYWGWNGRNF